LQSHIERQGVRQFEMQPSFTQVGDDQIIGSTQWVNANGAHENRYHVLTIRDGMIADMQVCASRRQARRFARRVSS
jgi:hypothetical protein